MEVGSIAMSWVKCSKKVADAELEEITKRLDAHF